MPCRSVRNFAGSPAASSIQVSAEDRRLRSVVHDFIRMAKEEEEDVKTLLANNNKNHRLRESLDHLESQLREAQSCVQDCGMSASYPHEEVRYANAAMERAASTLVDVIETLRVMPDEEQQPYKSVREQSAAAIRDLRHKLQQLEEEISSLSETKTDSAATR